VTSHLMPCNQGNTRSLYWRMSLVCESSIRCQTGLSGGTRTRSALGEPGTRSGIAGCFPVTSRTAASPSSQTYSWELVWGVSGGEPQTAPGSAAVPTLRE